MPSPLNPVRRIEAKKLLTYLIENEFFNADRFVDLLAEVMAGTPEVVKVAAGCLSRENTGKDLFALDSGSYEEIAEIVLDAAAVYQSETSEDSMTYKPRAVTQEDFAIWQYVITTLQGNRDCFQRAASGSVSKGAWEAQAAACSRGLLQLEQLLSNAGMTDDDKEV